MSQSCETTSSLVADFKSHEDQRMVADTEMNHTRFGYFFGRTIVVMQRSINVLGVGVVLFVSEIISIGTGSHACIAIETRATLLSW